MNASRNRAREAALWPVLAALCACGGGGSDGSPASASYDVRAAFTNFYTQNHTWNTSGNDNAVPPASWSLVQTMAPLPDAPFPVTGETLGSATSTSSLKRNGASNGTASGRAYFRHADATLVGADSGSAGGTCNIATAATPAPTSATLGMSGAYASVNILGGCSASSPTNASYTLGWSLELDTGVALLCMNEVISTSSGPSNQSYCYEIAPDGTLGIRARVHIADPQITLNMRNF